MNQIDPAKEDDIRLHLHYASEEETDVEADDEENPRYAKRVKVARAIHRSDEVRLQYRNLLALIP